MHRASINEGSTQAETNQNTTTPSVTNCTNPASAVCEILQIQQNISKLYLVHRLDNATSGCLLLAKSKAAAAILSEQFARRTVTKYYFALSDKKPKKKQGKVQGVMKKSRGGSYMLGQSLPNMNNSAFAVTFFFTQSSSNGRRLFYLKPITGKTHQIRVALKALGSPILGDNRYKGTVSDRLYLHSHLLGFEYLGEKVCVTCLPETGEYFNTALFDTLQSPEDKPWPNYTLPNERTTQDKKI